MYDTNQICKVLLKDGDNNPPDGILIYLINLE